MNDSLTMTVLACPSILVCKAVPHPVPRLSTRHVSPLRDFRKHSPLPCHPPQLWVADMALFPFSLSQDSGGCALPGHGTYSERTGTPPVPADLILTPSGCFPRRSLAKWVGRVAGQRERRLRWESTRHPASQSGLGATANKLCSMQTLGLPVAGHRRLCRGNGRS